MELTRRFAFAAAPSTLSIIIITLAGSFGLFVVLTLLTRMFLGHNHKRKLVAINRRLLTHSQEVRETNGCKPDQSKPTSRTSQLVPNISGAWSALTSEEDLVGIPEDFETERAVSQKHKSVVDLISWHWSGKKSKKTSLPLRRVDRTHLSSIMESPRTDSSSPNPQTRTKVDSTFHKNISQVHLPLIQIQHASPIRGFTPPGSPRSDVSPSLAINPRPLLAERSRSVPAFLASPEHAKTQSLARIARSRSTGGGFHMIGVAPTRPPPPVPKKTEEQILHQRQPISRRTSIRSASTMNSARSSILRSPVMDMAAEFSQRHPELGLGVHVREAETEMKRSLISNQTSPEKRNAPASTQVYGSSASQSDTAVTMATEEENVHPQTWSSYKAELEIAETRPIAAVSNPSAVGPSPIRVVGTPRRNVQMRKVSASGSPIQRNRTSVLKQLSENKEILLRDDSQTSMQSETSTGTNIFTWDPYSPVQQSKRSSRHKRQNCVRISLPVSRSASSLKMGDIAEESTDPVTSAGKYTGEYENRHFSRPPSTTTFSPALKRCATTLHASVNPTSPPLLLANHDGTVEDAPRQSDHSYAENSSARGESLRHSDTSSILMQSFPAPAETKQSAPYVPGINKRPSSKGFAANGDQSNNVFDDLPHIPGLKLVDKTKNAPPLLQFPTIDVVGTRHVWNQVQPELAASPSFSPHVTKQNVPPASSTQLHSGLSPPSKAQTTVKLSRTETSDSPAPSMSASTTLGPMKSRPNLEPPPSTPIPNYHENAPASDLIKSIKNLRRMDSEIMNGVLNVTPATRHYQNLGLESDPDLSNDEKENAEHRTIYIGVGNDQYSGISLKELEQSRTSKLNPPRKSEKRVNWGNVHVSWDERIAGPRSSLYDPEGFLIEGS